MDFGMANKTNGNYIAEHSKRNKTVECNGDCNLQDTADAKSVENSFQDTIAAKAAESEAEAKLGTRQNEWKRKFSKVNEEKQRQRVLAEQRAKRMRYEEYIKMLRASSLMRKLQEEENRRYSQKSVARDVALGAYGVPFIKRYSGFF